LSALLTHLVAIVPACTRECYSALVPLAAETREPLEAAERRWLQLRALTDGLYHDFVGRASQHATRLAAVLAIAEHIAANGEGLPLCIDASSVEAAVDIVEGYLLPMAERVLSEASAPKDGDAAALARFLARGANPRSRSGRCSAGRLARAEAQAVRKRWRKRRGATSSAR